MEWISVEDRMPPDKWSGLVVTDVRPDRPVLAHTSDPWYRRNFPYADYFLGRWREALLVGNHLRERARVTYWLNTCGEPLWPDPPAGMGAADED